MVTYTCPMHTALRRPEPGRCPKCNAALVRAMGRAHGLRDERWVTLALRRILQHQR
jgi:hypothetical protein